jgi:hypothetical protein
MTTRNGKIARLPHNIREQLNQRLQDGVQGKDLVAWLNGLPAVRSIIEQEFGSRPIREQNLSEWRTGGYLDWLSQRTALEKARELMGEMVGFSTAEEGELTETLAQFVTAQYIIAAKAVVRKAAGEAVGLDILRGLCNDISMLRRGDQNAKRLRIEQERLLLAEQDSLMKYKKKILAGLEILQKFVQGDHPEAKAAFEALVDQVRSPLDSGEGLP